MLLTAGVILIVFFVFCLLPADPARVIAGQRTDDVSTSMINHDFALDQPSHIRFLIYINDLLPLSIHNRKVKSSPIYLDPAKYKNAFKMFYFGTNKTIVFKSPYLRRSYHNKAAVYDMLSATFKSSAVLVSAAIALAVITGVLLGIIAGLYKRKWIGKCIVSISLIGISLPSFFIAILFSWIFGYVLQRYTGLNMTGGLYSIDPFEGEYLNWKNLILPAIALSLRPMSMIIQQTRTSFLEVMSKQYILVAKAKGLRKSMILFQHAWLNTTAPLVLLSNRWLGSMLAGTLFIEFVFGWKGVGSVAAAAIDHADLPVLMGVVILVSLVYIALTLITEILHSTLDPRIVMKIKHEN